MSAKNGMPERVWVSPFVHWGGYLVEDSEAYSKKWMDDQAEYLRSDIAEVEAKKKVVEVLEIIKAEIDGMDADLASYQIVRNVEDRIEQLTHEVSK